MQTETVRLRRLTLRAKLQHRLTNRLRDLSQAIDQGDTVGPICDNIMTIRARLDRLHGVAS